MSPRTGDHLGRERPHLRRRYRLCLPADVPQQVRRGRTLDARRVLPALLRQGVASFSGKGGKLRLTGPDGQGHHAARGVPPGHRDAPCGRSPRRTSTSRSCPTAARCSGQEARITVPARDLPVEDVSRVRGEANSMALSCAITTARCTCAACRAARRRARSSRRSNRSVSRRWAPAAWQASPTISRRSGASAPTSAATPASRPRMMRRSPT